MPASTAAATLTATYNDLESVKALFEANKGEIAGVILEPVVGNSGFIVPSKEFLQVCVLAGALRSQSSAGVQGFGGLWAVSLTGGISGWKQQWPSRASNACVMQRSYGLWRVTNHAAAADVDAASTVCDGCFAAPQGLRDMCTAEGAVLCFDEVMTGFRIARGCAQVRQAVAWAFVGNRHGQGSNRFCPGRNPGQTAVHICRSVGTGPRLLGQVPGVGTEQQVQVYQQVIDKKQK